MREYVRSSGNISLLSQQKKLDQVYIFINKIKFQILAFFSYGNYKLIFWKVTYFGTQTLFSCLCQNLITLQIIQEKP